MQCWHLLFITEKDYTLLQYIVHYCSTMIGLHVDVKHAFCRFYLEEKEREFACTIFTLDMYDTHIIIHTSIVTCL